MGSKLVNPPANAIYDRSSLQIITNSYDNLTHDVNNYTTSTTGTPINMIDNNLSTYYESQMTSANFNQSATITMLIDYQKLFLNTTLSWKYGGTHTSAGVGDKTATLYSSIDNVTYTQLDSVTIVRGGSLYTTSKASSNIALRYVKIICSAGENAGSDTKLQVFELRLMGSGGI